MEENKKRRFNRKGHVDGFEAQEAGLDRNGNPIYHTDDPNCTVGRKCRKGGRNFQSYGKFTPVEEQRKVVRLAESVIVRLVENCVRRALMEGYDSRQKQITVTDPEILSSAEDEYSRMSGSDCSGVLKSVVASIQYRITPENGVEADDCQVFDVQYNKGAGIPARIRIGLTRFLVPFFKENCEALIAPKSSEILADIDNDEREEQDTVWDIYDGRG